MKKDKRRHFFFKIKKDDFLKKTKVESIIKGLVLPKNKFPPDFFYQGRDTFIAGYFASYREKTTQNQLISLCQRQEWERIANFIGDFIILFCDLASKTIVLLTDQTSKFPCYFSINENELVMSTSFHQVLGSLPPASLDIPEALDYIHRNVGIKDQTFIKEIKQVPPATLFLLSQDWSYSLVPMIELENLLNQPFEKYDSVKEFADNFLSNLEGIVEEKFGAIKHLKFCADLSSGLDSSLISYLLKKKASKPFTCYSHIYKLSPRYTNPKIVKEFADKHGLKVRSIPHDHIFPFSTKTDLEWIKREPGQTGMADAFYDLVLVSKDGNEIEFTGEGGDEIFRMDAKSYEINLRFPIQVEYFERLSLANFGIGAVLTKKALNTLFDKERYQRKNPYVFTVPDSAITVYSNDFFPLFWETEVWPIAPFTDPRLAQIARGIPKPRGGHLTKQEIWRERQDIFVPSQFLPKRGPDEQFKRYLTESSGVVISVLKNSVLGSKGWAKSSEIIDNIRKGDIERYCRDDAMSYIVNLVGLEYFIQENGVKV